MATIRGTSGYPGQTPVQTRGTSDLPTSDQLIPRSLLVVGVLASLIFIHRGAPRPMLTPVKITRLGKQNRVSQVTFEFAPIQFELRRLTSPVAAVNNPSWPLCGVA